jgi:WD40 repeat protein
VGRPEREIDPEGGPLARFALDLRALRAAAGRPSYRQLARRAGFSVTALSEAAGGDELPTLPVTLAYVEACGGDVAAWEQRWRRLAAEVAPPADPGEEEAPYLGLSAFEARDAERFFGRERLVAELRDRLSGSPFLAVFAPSGAGKSSLLRAGLIPAAGEGWVTMLLTPGKAPVEELAAHLGDVRGVDTGSLLEALRDDPGAVRPVVRQVLDGRPEGTRLLLVVDQFEEVFTLCADERERATFIDLITTVTAEPGAHVVIGARADFYARCAAYPALVEALRDRQVLVGPMSDDDLRRVVAGPGRRAGLKVEAALVEAAVADARGQAGALPLLSHALLETWRRRRAGALTLAGYLAGGGVTGAIAQTAERVYGGFDADRRRLARDVFLRLTAFGEGTEDTRRHATPGELLDGPDGEALAAVLAELTEARLITRDAQRVTVAHEALIRGWPRLQAWLAEDREALRAHRRLTEAALEWERQGHDDGALYRGARLAAWEGRAEAGLNNTERAFLAASRRQQARERSAARRRTRLALAGLTAAVALVSLLAAIGFVQARRADAERDVAVSRQLIAEARSQSRLDPAQALDLARRAYALRPSTETGMALRQAVTDRMARAVVPVGSEQALGVAFSPDGRRLAVSDVDGLVRVWDRTADGVTGAPAYFHGFHEQAWTPVFSRDGERLAAASVGGTIRVWDARRRTTLAVFTGHSGQVWAVAFAPDGRRLVSAGEDGTVRVWDTTAPGAPPLVLRGHDGPALNVAFAADGRRVASGGSDGTVRIWDVPARRQLTVLIGHEEPVKSVAFTADGARVASASVDGTARVWPWRGGAPVVLRGHQGTVEAVAVSPDGHRIATGSDDRTIRVWNSAGGPGVALHGHQGTVWAVAFSPDGARLASAAGDATVRVWDPRGPGDPLILRGHEGAVWAAAFAPGGGRVVSGGTDGAVRVWAADGTAAPPLLGHTEEVLGLAVSPDGSRVASASRDRTVRIWDLAGGGPPVVLRGHTGPVWIAAFSPDGRRLASASKDGTVRIWDTAGGPATRSWRADPDQPRYVAFSPDGRRVATGGMDGTVRIWDPDGGAEPVVLRGHSGLVWAVAYSPDGRHLASSGSDGTVRIWSTEDPATPPRVLRGHQGFVWHVAYSPDGRWVAGTGQDGTLRIWRAAEGGEPVTFPGFAASVEQVAFAPGERLVTTHDDGTVRLWRCEVCAPIEHVAALAAS